MNQNPVSETQQNQQDQNNFVIIMAGGVGSRLWPFSRESFPKQFHDILEVGQTLIQATVHRFRNICPTENIFIITNKKYENLVKEQLPFLSDDQVLLEPIKRNTAPCIAYASYKIAIKNPQANIIVAPADHIIKDLEAFENAMFKALKATTSKDILVTLGIKPTRPDTGYGYIQFEEEKEDVRKVRTFTEKPKLPMAQQFVDSGEFVWNAGIFVWNARTIKGAIKAHLPDLHEVFSDAEKDFYSENEEAAVKKAYSLCKVVSIDKGVMEKAENVYVIMAGFEWSDLGTWKSLDNEMRNNEQHNVDDNKNVIVGNVSTYNAYNNIIKTPQEKLVVVQGLSDYIIAEYDNVLLICRKEDEQKVKDFVNDAKAKGGEFI
mgnify:CR=1 FL=1